MLSSRERLLRFFAGRDIDRGPIWLLFPHHPLGCYVDVFSIPCYAPIVERIRRGDADTFDRRGCERRLLYTASERLRFHTETAGRDSTTSLECGDIRLTRSTTYGERTRVKFYVDDPAQLKALMDIPYEPIRPDLAPYRREKEELGDRGLSMMDLGDPLCILHGLMDPADFAMATATDPDILTGFLDAMLPRVLDLYRYFLEADIADAFFIVGAEFAGPPLVSPKKFEELSVKYVKGICDLIRSYGKISIVHYHGNLRTILGGMRAIGPDGLHTIEQPPIGNCTIQQAREGLRGVALIGPVQYDDLIRLNPEQIQEQVRDAYQQAGGTPFILSPTAGPYEPFIDQRAVANYEALLDAGLRYGKR